MMAVNSECNLEPAFGCPRGGGIIVEFPYVWIIPYGEQTPIETPRVNGSDGLGYSRPYGFNSVNAQTHMVLTVSMHKLIWF